MSEHFYSREFFSVSEFQDRFLDSDVVGIDVVMPIMNTNLFYESNLVSIFRELPVQRLIVGDGGSSDDSLEILAKFPRITIIDQREMKTLGACLKQLIEEVTTENFAYLHSDVYLPFGVHNAIASIDLQQSWVESSRNTLIVHEQEEPDLDSSGRSYSGFQIGSASLLKNVLSIVEDDYLYRNEDIVISELVQAAGGKFIKKHELVHLHQAVSKNSENEPSIKATIYRESDPEWEANTAELQYKGLVKYLNPQEVSNQITISKMINENINLLNVLQSSSWKESKKWVQENNPAWLPYLKKKSLKSRVKNRLSKSTLVTAIRRNLKG